MGRYIDPDSQYRIKIHKTRGYTYASTQPPTIDPETGKKKYRHVHWGAVDKNLVFVPGSAFYLVLPEERARLISPEDWDMSEAAKLTGLRKPGRPAYDDDCQNRLYGDIWLLEQVATKTGMRQDQEKVFDGNREIVDDILTLAMSPTSRSSTIRLIEHTNRAKGITPFVGTQVDICKAFGFEIPEGCAPAYTSRQKSKQKRGHSPKKSVEWDF